MKFTLFFASIVGLAVAVPMPADDTPDWNRKYTCEKRVQGYCHASNIRSYCTRNGEFRSNAMDTCGSFCHC